MVLAEFAVKNSVVTWLAAFMLAVAGYFSFQNLAKLEDPNFTIKTAAIVTSYPGASPEEVEMQLSNLISEKLQEIPEIKYVNSESRAGLSFIKLEIKSEYWSDALPQIWDTLRRKVRDIESSLPAGAGTPVINDDLGDVYGFVLAITGDGFSYQELEDNVKSIKKRLSLVDGVARINMWGKLPRAVYLHVKESRLADLGLTAKDIQMVLTQQNKISATGNAYFNEMQSRIEISGDFGILEDIRELTVSGRFNDSDRLIKIRDFADVEQGFIEPASQMMRFNGKQSLALAISNSDGASIIDLGNNLAAEVEALQEIIPVGIEISRVAWQANEVDEAISGFTLNLLESIIIVLVVLTLAMGWRMGVIIGTSLVLTILGTLVFMSLFGINLQRMSLGALVIALGMMVDNSIVVADGVLVLMEKGKDKMEAAIEAASKPSIPLLGATAIAVLAFYPIGGSTDSTGEYCLSLFQVVGISLLFSWLVSVTVTPLQSMMMIKVDPETTGENQKDPFDTKFFKFYRSILETAIRFRVITIAISFGLLLLALSAFSLVPKLFFPDSSRAQFMVDMYAQNGTRIEQTSSYLEKAEEKVLTMDGVESVGTFIGSGPPRFYLPVEPERIYTSYGQLIVTVDDFQKIDGIKSELQPWLEDTFPEVPVFRVRKYGVGPANTWKFELRVSAPAGTSNEDIRAQAQRGLDIVDSHPMTMSSQLDWRDEVTKLVIDYEQDRGRRAGISRNDVADATTRAFDGVPLGRFRYGEESYPVLMRNAGSEREDPSSIYSVQIPKELERGTVPLAQVADDINIVWEDPYVWRRNRLPTVTIQAEPITGVTLPSMREALLPAINDYIDSLPTGYIVEWGAEAESSAEAQSNLIPGIIPSVALMLFIIVALFNAMKPAAIIFTILPLTLIGIVFGLLIFNASFGFMALLGSMSLVGMMIKNAIVLLDEIRLNLDERGFEEYEAVINAGMSRLRPVALAAATTVLGVATLVQDVFWVSMSVTIMAGLTFGTLLTMIIVPVLYTMYYKVDIKDKGAKQSA